MRDREIVCRYYSCEGGECQKRNVDCHFNNEMQHCKLYEAKRHALPRRENNKKQKLDKIRRAYDKRRTD